MTRKTEAAEGKKSYPRFLASLNLMSISLVRSRFSGDRQQYFKNKAHQLSVSWTSKTSKRGEDFFDIGVDVAISLAVPKSDVTFFDLTASYLLHVHAPAPLNKVYIKRFSDSEVRLLVWPYVREYVSNISGRMHVPPIVLPLTGSDEA